MASPTAARSAQPMSVAALLTQARKSASYPGTQQNLYSYSNLAWDNYLVKLPDFTAYSAMYTQTMADDAKAAITSASGLPSYEAVRMWRLVICDRHLRGIRPSKCHGKRKWPGPCNGAAFKNVIW